MSEVDKWDDTVLIEAFTRAMNSYPRGWGSSEQQTVEAVSADEEEEEEEEDQGSGEEMSAAEARFASLLDKGKAQEEAPSYGEWRPVEPQPAPPAPPLHPAVSDPDGLSDLLMSWYYAGYYTGRYRALQEMRHGGGPRHVG